MPLNAKILDPIGWHRRWLEVRERAAVILRPGYALDADAVVFDMFELGVNTLVGCGLDVCVIDDSIRRNATYPGGGHA